MLSASQVSKLELFAHCIPVGCLLLLALKCLSFGSVNRDTSRLSVQLHRSRIAHCITMNKIDIGSKQIRPARYLRFPATPLQPLELSINVRPPLHGS